jgi:hypothetical protein
MRLHRFFAAFALAGPLVLGCAPSVTIDAPDIEVTQPNLSFPAPPVGAQGTVEDTFLLSSNKLGAAGGPDAGASKRIQRLDLIRLAFTADTGIQDFTFLTHLTVTAKYPPGGRVVACHDLAEVTILDYDVPPGTGAVLAIPMSPPVDLRSLWACPSLSVTVQATGTAPVVATGTPLQDNWSMDVVFSLSVRISQ